MLISSFFRGATGLAAVAMLLGFSETAQAQDPGKPRLGLKTGLVLSRLTGDDVDGLAGVDYRTRTDGRRPDFMVSLASTIPLSSTGLFTLAPEFSYTNKGYRLTQTFVGTTGLEAGESKRILLVKRRISYFEVPLALRVNTTGGLYFEVGPQVSYRLSSKTTTETTRTFSDGRPTATAEASVTQADDVQQLDVSALAGVGIQHRSGLTVGLRYTRGVKTVLDRATLPNRAITNNDALLLQLGYLIQLGK